MTYLSREEPLSVYGARPASVNGMILELKRFFGLEDRGIIFNLHSDWATTLSKTTFGKRHSSSQYDKRHPA